jgi:hypothetical protein
MSEKHCMVCRAVGVAHDWRVVMWAADGRFTVAPLALLPDARAPDATVVAAVAVTGVVVACAGNDIDRATATNVAVAVSSVSTWGRARMSPPHGSNRDRKPRI